MRKKRGERIQRKEGEGEPIGREGESSLVDRNKEGGGGKGRCLASSKLILSVRPFLILIALFIIHTLFLFSSQGYKVIFIIFIRLVKDAGPGGVKMVLLFIQRQYKGAPGSLTSFFFFFY